MDRPSKVAASFARLQLATVLLVLGCSGSSSSSPSPAAPSPAGASNTAPGKQRPSAPSGSSIATPSYAIGSFEVVVATDIGERHVAIELSPPDAELGGELLKRGAVARRAGRLLELDLAKLVAPGAEVKPGEYRQCSFAIDCDDERVSALREASSSAGGGAPSPAELRRFVSQHIHKKNLAHGMSPASATAELREGDCSEHAMLLAAVARLHGHAARPVFGIALIRSPEGAWAAFGHAWTEILEGGQWRIYDAALIAQPVITGNKPPRASVETACPIYVPIDTLASEGPDFGRHSTAFLLHVHRVKVPSSEALQPERCWLPASP